MKKVMTDPNHVHRYTQVVRIRGTRERRQCTCKAIGPWRKQPPVPLPRQEQPVIRSLVTELRELTVTRLRELAKEAGLRGYSRMTKDELIDALTEVPPRS